MAKTAVNELLVSLDAAFMGEDWHSLLRNLRSVTTEDWEWVPPGGRRSIRDIVGHVGGCKFVYENRAFGDATLSWEDPQVTGDGKLDDFESALDWLNQGHTGLRRGLADLEDADLDRGRLTHREVIKPIRWFITTMTQHDLYHSGEINHIRALHQGDDY